MKTKSASMHVAIIKHQANGKTYVSYLLRQSYRDGPHVKHRTLANLSHLPARVIDIIRRSLQGETFVAAAERFRTSATVPHGHVEAVLGTIRKLGLDTLIAAKRSRQRDLVLAL